MTLKKSAARLGAGSLALATVLAGISFGPAAANATPSDESAPFKLVYQLSDGRWFGSGHAPQATAAAAEAITPSFRYNTVTRQLVVASGAAEGNCAYMAGGGDLGLLVSAKCDDSAENQRWIVSGTGGFLNDIAPLLRMNSHAERSGPTYYMKSTPGAEGKWGPNSGYFPLSGTVSSKDLRARTADLSGQAAPGSTLIINDSAQVAVGADGKWSYTVTGLKLGKNTVKIEQYEGDNNKTGETSVVVDLTVAAISAKATFTPEDNTKPLVISGTAQAGANVEIWNGATKLVTVPAADVTGAFTADVPAPNAGGVQSYTVKQVLQGEIAPDVKTVTADFGAAVTIVTPVDGAVHDGGDLRFQGRGVAGGKVALREQGKQGVIGSVDVLANGIWTIDASLPGKKATYVATLTGKGNNVTVASVTLNPDGDLNPPVVAPVAPGSNELVGSGGTPGATIIVRDKDGKELGRDTVDKDGNWNITVPVELGPGQHDLEIIEENDGQTSEPTDVTVDFGAAVKATGASADDKGIVTLTGTGQVGATIEVKGKSGRTIATATVGADGKWTAVSTFTLPAQAYLVDVFQTTGINVKSSAEIAFEIKASAPIAKPVTFTGPAANSTVDRSKPVFSGKGEPGAKIIVRGSVRTVAETTVRADGTWEVSSSIALGNGSYALTAVQTPTNGAAPSQALNTFLVNYVPAAKLIVTSPEEDGTVAGPRPTFAGTGEAGATITIKGTTRVVATATVKADGTWAATSTIDLASTAYVLTATQDAKNGDTDQATMKFIVS